jgi:hypothetical protein
MTCADPAKFNLTSDNEEERPPHLPCRMVAQCSYEEGLFYLLSKVTTRGL